MGKKMLCVQSHLLHNPWFPNYLYKTFKESLTLNQENQGRETHSVFIKSPLLSLHEPTSLSLEGSQMPAVLCDMAKAASAAVKSLVAELAT